MKSITINVDKSMVLVSHFKMPYSRRFYLKQATFVQYTNCWLFFQINGKNKMTAVTFCAKCQI